MHVCYKAYAVCCGAQLPMAALMLFLGYTCSVEVLSVAVSTPPLVLGGVAFFPSDAGGAVCPADSPRGGGGSNGSAALPPAFTVGRRTLDHADVYAVACAAAALVGLLSTHLLGAHEGGDAGLHPALPLVSNLVFLAFAVAHAVTLAATTTESLAPYERLLLRVSVRVACVTLVCALPRKDATASALVCLCATALLLEAWCSLEAVCRQGAAVLCLAQRCLDALLVLGYRFEDEPPTETILQCRLFYTAASAALLQAAVPLRHYPYHDR